jgi:DNA-binding transcriptional LysR family regulator
MEKFCQQHPRVTLHVDAVNTRTPLELPALHNRKCDLVLGHFAMPLPDDQSIQDLDIELLYKDQLVVATGTRSRWSRRRRIELAELVDEPWIVGAAPDSWNYVVISEAFRSRGLRLPKMSLMTFSVHLRANMVASGHFITTFPTSIMRQYGDRFALKALPVDLPYRPWAVALVTLKHRTLSPVVERFVDHVRDFGRPMRGRLVQNHRSTASSRNA